MSSPDAPDHPLHTAQEALWLLIALLTPLFVNFWVEQQFEASKVWLLRTLVWLLALLWLAGRLLGLPRKPLLPAVRHLVIALVLVMALSTALSGQRPLAFFGSLDRAHGFLTQIVYLLLFGCVAAHIDAPRSRQLLGVMVLTAVPISLLGLAQSLGWQPLPVLSDARSPLTTTLGRANFTGAYLALLLPLTLMAAQLAANNWRRLAYLALFGLEILVIILTEARAAWIAAVVGMALLWWLQVAPGWSRRNRWVSGLAGITMLAGALLLVLQRGIASGGSIAARWTIWQASLRLLWPRLWLGYGADTLELYFPSVYPPPLVYYQGRGVVVDRAHNWLLDGSLNYGVVATLIFGALVILILMAGWRYIAIPANAGQQSLETGWVAAGMAAVCAQLVGNLFLFEVAATAVLFWLLLAIITAATHEKMLAETHPHPAGKAVIVGGVFLVGGLIWLGSVGPLLADFHSWQGTKALNQGNAERALLEYETAVTLQPHRAPYQVAVGLTAAQLNKFEQAEKALLAAIALRPTDPVLLTQLAAIYAHQANLSGSPENIRLAYDAYEQAITLAPTLGLINQQYADLALRTGDIETARRQAQRAVDLDATDGVAFGILGWAQLQTGNLTAAQNAFAQAVRWQPDSADFYLGLATVHFQQEDFEAARQAVEASLVRDPSYAPAVALQAQLP